MGSIGDGFLLVFGGSLTNILGALVFLCVGWFLAFVFSSIAKGIMRKARLDSRFGALLIGEKKHKRLGLENGLAKAVYYIAMLFVLVGFFEALGFNLIAQPLNRLLNELTSYAPRIAGALALFALAWILAGLAKRAVMLSMERLDLNTHVKSKGDKDASVSESVGELVYWLVFLFFLPGIIDALAIKGLLDPVKNMIDKALEFIPNLFAAAIILAFGWFIARVVQRVVKNFSIASGAEAFSKKAGLDTILAKASLSDVLGAAAYALVMLPVIISALEALKVEALTRPASNMLNAVMMKLPEIFSAALIILAALVLGRLARQWVSNILASLGFDSIMSLLGLGERAPKGSQSPSKIMGHLAFLAVMLFSAMEAFVMIGMSSLSSLIQQFILFASNVSLGLIILAAGMYLANLAAGMIRASGSENSPMISSFARASILVLSGAMSLSRMGLANDIINMAFGLLLGSLALAFAIAFGLGGRDFACSVLKKFETGKR